MDWEDDLFVWAVGMVLIRMFCNLVGLVAATLDHFGFLGDPPPPETRRKEKED